MDGGTQRAALDACTEQIPCATRRRLIGGLATLAATASLPHVVAKQDQYHAAVSYLHGEFMDAASRLGQAEGKTFDILYRRMLALATGLSVIPAGAARSVRLKREVAGWLRQDGQWTMRLPCELVASLIDDGRS